MYINWIIYLLFCLHCVEFVSANCCVFVWNLLVRVRVKSCTILLHPILFLHLLISLKVLCFWTFKTFILFVNYILLISGQRHGIIHLHSCRECPSPILVVFSLLHSGFSFSLCFLNFKFKSSTVENTIELI